MGDIITKVNDAIYSVVGGIPMIAILLATGLFCTIMLGGIQFRRFGTSIKSIFSKMFSKQKAADGSMTPFQAVCTALASTVGTGNIAGTAGAITLGGPGAVFWMWVSAILGMATKYSEITLAIKFREKNEKGEWVGGPMYYIKNGLSKNWRWLAYAFAAFCALAAFGTGNMTQVNTIASTINSAIQNFSPAAAESATIIALIIGAVVAVIVALVLFGGLKRIGKVTELLIPFMSVIFIVGGLVVVICNGSNVGSAFKSIFEGAFKPSAVCGGVLGMTIKKTMQKGIGRGIFSNEAGLGSAPIAHATADTDSPVRQGLFGVFEVFVDTILICTLSALIILTSGISIPYGVGAGAELTTSAMGTVFGGNITSIFMSVAITLFGLSTILGWALYGGRCVEFIFKKNISVTIYYIVYIAVLLLGATVKLDLVWAIAETLNCFMAIPNLVGVFALAGTVKKLTKEYFSKDKMLEPKA